MTDQEAFAVVSEANRWLHLAVIAMNQENDAMFDKCMAEYGRHIKKLNDADYKVSTPVIEYSVPALSGAPRWMN